MVVYRPMADFLEGIDEFLNTFSADPNYCAGKFPVVADTDGKIAKSYALKIQDIGAGHKDTRGVEIDHAMTERTTFLVTPDGKISSIVVSPFTTLSQPAWRRVRIPF